MGWGIAIAAIIGAGAGVYESSQAGKKTGTSTGTQTPSPPTFGYGTESSIPGMQSYLQGLLGTGNQYNNSFLNNALGNYNQFQSGFVPPSLPSGGISSLIPGGTYQPSQTYQQGMQSLSDILGGQYDPTKNPEGFQAAYSAASQPLIQQFQNQILPSLKSQGVASGVPRSTGQSVAQALASNNLTTNLSNLSSQLFSNQQTFGGNMLQSALGKVSSMEQTPYQAAMASLGVPAAYYQAQNAAYSPYTSQMNASYLPTQLQTGTLSNILGLQQPGIQDLMNLLQMTSSGAGGQTSSTYPMSYPSILSGALSGAAGGTNLGVNAYLISQILGNQYQGAQYNPNTGAGYNYQGYDPNQIWNNPYAWGGSAQNF